jgi:tetratricopeptide (TPR) repeat protein
MNNNNFNELRCTLLLGLSVESFATGNSRQAFEYIQNFEEVEELYPINFNTYIINDAVVEAYSRAASYYYRKGNFKVAKHFLNKGLKYAPNSYELKNKLNSIY